MTETQVDALATRSVDQEELIHKEQEVNIFPNSFQSELSQEFSSSFFLFFLFFYFLYK